MKDACGVLDRWPFPASCRGTLRQCEVRPGRLPGGPSPAFAGGGEMHCGILIAFPCPHEPGLVRTRWSKYLLGSLQVLKDPNKLQSDLTFLFERPEESRSDGICKTPEVNEVQAHLDICGQLLTQYFRLSESFSC